MNLKNTGAKKRVAIIGAGPSGLFALKRFVEAARTEFIIDIFERKSRGGAGMPYSAEGANPEHITNVSDNEIPAIVSSIEDWVKIAPRELLSAYNISTENFNEFKVLPRLFFGEYLAAQFSLLLAKAADSGITVNLHTGVEVTDILDEPAKKKVQVATINETFSFDAVIVSSGHNWPKNKEGEIQGWFDSPYPPAKLRLKLDHPVAIKGSSLTAIDAIRTLARENGSFAKKDDRLKYHLNEDSSGFRLILHSRSGLLPAVRFHLEDSHLGNKSLLTKEEIAAHIADNEGFLSLDYIFNKDFKAIFRTHDPAFFDEIKDLSIEDFVTKMMALRERVDPFLLLKAEFTEAEKSIKRKESVYWKEMLAVLSFAMNYPAKHLSAEDMLRLQSSLMPLISIVIAFVPQSSCTELLALHDAGVLSLLPVGAASSVSANGTGGAIYHFTDEDGKEHQHAYKTFVDCVGQPHLSLKDLPYPSLLEKRSVTAARLKFRRPEAGTAARAAGAKVEADSNGDHHLLVPGIAIDDRFRILDQYGAFNERIYMMAVPYIGGFNPDYSGLDFSAEASAVIVSDIISAG